MSSVAKKGHALGLDRVLDDPKVLPQNANQLNPHLPLFSNEIEIKVEALQIDASSFRQLSTEYPDEHKLKEVINAIIVERGKMQNPVTGSGGILLGKISAIGEDFPDRSLAVGQPVATLISLTATPLRLSKIHNIDFDQERLLVEGVAYLPEQSLYAVMPDDLNEGVALAAFDICGAPPLVCRYVEKGHTVFLLGLGKAGRSVLSALNLHFGSDVKIIGADASADAVEFAHRWSEHHGRNEDQFTVLNAQDPIQVLNWVSMQTDDELADVSINLVNVQNTEMPTVLATKNRGSAIFFSMATDFQKATLGAEASAKDVQCLMGLGYVAGHAEFTLNLLRQDSFLKSYFEGHMESKG